MTWENVRSVARPRRRHRGITKGRIVELDGSSDPSALRQGPTNRTQGNTLNTEQEDTRTEAERLEDQRFALGVITLAYIADGWRLTDVNAPVAELPEVTS